MQRLPKQWKNWCQRAGLRLYSGADSYSRREGAWYYLRGHGRVWRLNCHHMLQCGDTLQEFDRWALCNIVETAQPTSLAQFKVAVRALVNSARQLDAQGWGEDCIRQVTVMSPSFPDNSARYNPFTHAANRDDIARLMLAMVPSAS